MTEPVLTYKKGEGWVYDNTDSIETKDRGGRLVRLVRRTPEINEPYFLGYTDMEQNVKHMNRYNVGQFDLWHHGYEVKDEDCITIVPLD